MSEVLELSSDSNDTVIVSTEQDQENIQSIVDKYISEQQLQEKELHRFSTDYSTDVPLIKRPRGSGVGSQPNNAYSESPTFQDEIETLQMLSEKYKPVTCEKYQNKARPSRNNFRENVTEVENLKEIRRKGKELQKLQKVEERAFKKKQLEEEKLMKQALATANKNLKPTECIKFITVMIDGEISTESYGTDITTALQEANVRYKVCSQIFNHTITWIRKTHDAKINKSAEDDVEEILLIMNCREFIDRVHNATLSAYVQSLKSVLNNKRVTLVIYGLQSYKRFQKNKKHREMKFLMGDESESQTINPFFKDFPKVTDENIENALTELQLLCFCSHRLIDSGPELGQLVFQFTKAVAEIPYKLQKYEKFQKTDWFIAGDNRNCVKIDRNGNGLSGLWNQMLTTFPLARLETAEAVSSKYATVSALMKAYDECQSAKEGELLLQDIPVRRAAGPLSSSRKVGPELSKKIYTFFTSTDGDVLL